MTWTDDLMPSAHDVAQAAAREALLPEGIRHRVAWFWRPYEGRYDLCVLRRGKWVVIPYFLEQRENVDA